MCPHSTTKFGPLSYVVYAATRPMNHGAPSNMPKSEKDASYALGARHAREGKEARTRLTIPGTFGRLTEGKSIEDDDVYDSGYYYELGKEHAKEGFSRQTGFLGHLMLDSEEVRDAYNAGFDEGLAEFDD